MVMDEGMNDAVATVGAENGPKLIQRMLVTSYKIPEGQRWTFNHEAGCKNTGNEEMWNRAIEAGKPKTISELNTILRLLFTMSGCQNCGINKETSVGVLFTDSQDSSFVPSMKSTQDSYTSVASPSSLAPSWPTSSVLDGIPSSEKKLYKNFKMDCSSDNTYSPPRGRKPKVETLGSTVDVSMSLDKGKTTEGNGVGDSKWADIPGTQVSNPETVGYTQMPSQEMEMVEATEKAERNESASMPAIAIGINAGALSSSEEKERRLERLERLMMEVRDELDELKDVRADVRADIIANGCKECRANTPKVNKGKGPPKPPANKVVLSAVPKRIPAAKPAKQLAKVMPTAQPSAGPSCPPPDKVASAGNPSWAEVGRSMDNTASFSIVPGRKRFSPKKATRATEPEISLRECHVKIWFVAGKGDVTELLEGITTESVRECMNQYMINLN